MPYKCVHCSAVYVDGANEVLSGCTQCHSKFFFYIKEDKLQQIIKHEVSEPVLSATEKEQIEEDVREIAGVVDEEIPVFLDFESVKIVKPGKVEFGNFFIDFCYNKFISMPSHISTIDLTVFVYSCDNPF